jgi:hypothetical protein
MTSCEFAGKEGSDPLGVVAIRPTPDSYRLRLVQAPYFAGVSGICFKNVIAALAACSQANWR